MRRWELIWNAGHDTRALQAYVGHRNIQHAVRYGVGAQPIQGFLAVTAVRSTPDDFGVRQK